MRIEEKEPPLACNMTALDQAQRQRWQTLSEQLLAATKSTGEGHIRPVGEKRRSKRHHRPQWYYRTWDGSRALLCESDPPPRTPFNIGHRIELTDFTFEEARPLARGLHKEVKIAERLLNQVLHWTGGQPYLTQKLCAALVETSTLNATEQSVDELTRALFFSDTVWEDVHFTTIRDRILEDKENPEALLEMYRQIRSGGPVLDDERSPVHSSLKLSGIVKVFPGGWLRPRNKIYEQVFDLDWVSTAQPSERVRQGNEMSDKFRTLPAISENIGLAQDLDERLRQVRGYEEQADGLWVRFIVELLTSLIGSPEERQRIRKEWIGRMEENIKQWKGLVRRNEDILSRLEHQIERLENQAESANSDEYEESVRHLLVEKRIRIETLRKTNRMLEDKIQLVTQKLQSAQNRRGER